MVGFKGGTLECYLLTELKIPYLDLEKVSCPKFKDMTRLGTMPSCGYHMDSWHHHCARVECYYFVNWVCTQLGLGADFNIVNVQRTLRFLSLK